MTYLRFHEIFTVNNTNNGIDEISYVYSFLDT